MSKLTDFFHDTVNVIELEIANRDAGDSLLPLSQHFAIFSQPQDREITSGAEELLVQMALAAVYVSSAEMIDAGAPKFILELICELRGSKNSCEHCTTALNGKRINAIISFLEAVIALDSAMKEGED